jgi:hypothetical protein
LSSAINVIKEGHAAAATAHAWASATSLSSAFADAKLSRQTLGMAAEEVVGMTDKGDAEGWPAAAAAAASAAASDRLRTWL